MEYKVNRQRKAREKIYQTNEELIESHINGNRSYVREKFKNMKHERKGIFLSHARETLNKEDYDDLVKSLYQ